MKTNGIPKTKPILTDEVLRFRRLINSQAQPDCPFLGLKDDPETHTRFASEENCCHAQKKPHRLELDHQQMHCLFEYTRCEVFLKRMAAEAHAAQPLNRRPLGVFRVFNNLLGLK